MSGASMYEVDNPLFIGIKISPKLQSELDNCPPGAEHFFKEDKPESLQIVSLGSEMLIGRFLQDGLPVSDIDNVSRNVWCIVKLITHGHRVAEDSARI
jgi:hypothetical protein